MFSEEKLVDREALRELDVSRMPYHAVADGKTPETSSWQTGFAWQKSGSERGISASLSGDTP